MNRKIALIVFLVIFAHQLHATEERGVGYMADISFRFLWSDSHFSDLLQSRFMGFLNVGGGLHYTFLPNILSPGLYLDAGISNSRFFSDDVFDEETAEDIFSQGVGLTFGGRLYNFFNIRQVGVKVFAGYNIILGFFNLNNGIISGNPILGTSIQFGFTNFGLLGLEYTYYIPTNHSNNIGLHHFSLIFRHVW